MFFVQIKKRKKGMIAKITADHILRVRIEISYTSSLREMTQKFIAGVIKSFG